MRCRPLLISGLLLLPLPATAATLGLRTLPAPEISGAAVSFNEPGFGFLLSGDDAAVATAPVAATGLSVIVPYADLTALLGAIFVTDGEGNEFLSGDLMAVGYVTGPGEDVLELLFEGLSGSAAAHFGRGALLAVRGEFGSDPLGLGFGSFDSPVDASFAINPVVVPVGPALGYLVAGLGGMVLARKARHR